MADNFPKKKFVLAKGFLGFGDRLQALSYSLEIAKRYNRNLYVDWLDDDWGKSFYDYFYLDGFPPILPTGSAYPEVWTDDLHRPAGKWIVQHAKGKPIFELNIEGLANATGNEDVWVHPSIGYRSTHFPTLVRTLKITCMDKIKPMMAPEGTQKVVHLRGTDRKVDETRLLKLMDDHPEAVIISDDAVLVDRWKERHPHALVLSDTLVRETSTGSHNMEFNLLAQKYNFTKRQLHYRTIADFLTLAYAPEAHALNTDSRYFMMARLWGRCMPK